MEYQLIGNGKLRAGVDEARAIGALHRLTWLSAEDIRQKLLSGKRVRLKRSTDKAQIESLYAALTEVGLDVEVIASPTSALDADGAKADKAHLVAKSTDRVLQSHTTNADSPRPRRRRWRAVAAVLLCLIVGAGGYAWYWINAPLPADAQAAEAALADGTLVAISHVNVEKLVELHRYAFGELDPDALPVEDDDKELLDRLFTGPANFRERLAQLFFAVHASAERPRAQTTLLLYGSFDRDAVLGGLRGAYDVEPARIEPWLTLSEKREHAQPGCPGTPTQERQPMPSYLLVTQKRLVLVSDLDHGDALLRRLEEAAAAAQDLAAWRQYRAGKLASIMVLSTSDAATALTGLAGMAAQQAASQSTQATGLAAGLGVDVLAGGLNANLRLVSEDAEWNRQTSAKAREQLDVMKGDTRTVSPTLAELMSRITVSDEAHGVEFNVALDFTVLDHLAQALQEGIGSIFSVGISDAQQPDGSQPDQIQTRPKDYAANAALEQLPQLKLESYQSQPLFMRDAFSVDLSNIRLSDQDVLEMKLGGIVALPKGESNFGEERTADLSFAVSSVTDVHGNDLLRDERCVSRNEIFGRSRNHEPETTGSMMQDRAMISKHVRLQKGTKVEDIDRIRGILSLTVPVAVSAWAVPLRAGESVSHAGMRFYLARVRDRSVSYHVSGDKQRLLEVRALNVDGKPLRTSWRMSGEDGGRVTQNYEGQVHALKAFVADRFVEHKVDFELTRLFSPRSDDDPARPAVLAPERIDPGAWAPYAQLNMDTFVVDPQQWHVFPMNKDPVARATWPGVSMFLTHTPQQWGNAPQAHVYYPMLPELPGVLSALSYQIEYPAAEGGVVDRYCQASYPYRMPGAEVVVRYRHGGQPLALGSWPLITGLKENERLTRLKGKLVFRLPVETVSTTLTLDNLWQGKTVDGVTVSLTEVSRGTFPGYGLKIAGELSRLVNLHGLDAGGEWVAAQPINFQDAGYWTMTLPFGRGIEQVELILARRQRVMEYPFDVTPVYPTEQ